MTRAPRAADAGFTLVEVLVALALFALIGSAGFAVLDQILRVQTQTDGRLERLAALQRTMHVITQDFLQATGGTVVLADGGVAFRRSGDAAPLAVAYGLDGDVLMRSLARPGGGAAARQALLGGVGALDWRFYAADTGWVADWPPPPPRPGGNPAAVELALTLEGAGLGGGLRRVAILPAERAP